MKKVFVMMAFVAAMLFAGNAKAQVAVHASYSPESWSSERNTLDVHSYSLGIDFMIPVISGVNVSIGAQGRWSTESGDDSRFVFDTNHSTNIVGIEVPVLVNYSFKLDDNWKITPFAGPKFSYFIKGRTRSESGHPIYEWFDEDIEAQRMNNFNLSATFGLAVSFQHFHLFGGYNVGLLDMDNDENISTKVGGTFIGLAVGF